MIQWESDSCGDEKSKEFLGHISKLKDLGHGKESCQTVEEGMRNVLEFYSKNKKNIDEALALRTLQLELPNNCFQHHVEDSYLVSDILQAIFKLSPSLDTLVKFMERAAYTYRTLDSTEIKLRNEIGKGSFDFLTYFLHHARRRKLTFEGVTMSETAAFADPVSAAELVFFADTRCVRSLLQYGLRFDTTGSHDVHPVFICAAEFISYLIQNQNSMEGGDQDSFQRRISNFTRNFELLLQSTRNPHKVTFEMASTILKLPGSLECGQIERYLRRTFPDLDFSSHRPASLQHLCRHSVRSALRDTWSLPYGVWKLPAARKLQRYLNYMNTDL